MEMSLKQTVVITLIFLTFFLTASCSQSKEGDKQGSVKNGRILYGKLKCSYCHKINDEGGTTGPDLTRIGAKNLGIDWHVRNLVDPQSAHPRHPESPQMPQFDKLTDKMLIDLATYLESLR